MLYLRKTEPEGPMQSNQKIIQTPDIIFYIFLLVGAGHYSSFM